MKDILKDHIGKVKTNIYIIILLAVILFICSFISILPAIKNYQNIGGVFSWGDVIVSVSHPFIIGFFIVPVFLIMNMFVFKNDFSQNYILKNKSRAALWYKQIFQVFIGSIFYTLFVSIIVIFIANIFTPNLVNWNSKESIFFAITGTLSSVDLIVVIGVFMVDLILILVISEVILLGIFWKTNNYQYGWILLIGIFIWDLVIPKEFNLGLLYNRLLLNYKYWTTFPKELLNTAGFFIVLILLIYTFEHFVNRREFLNE